MFLPLWRLPNFLKVEESKQRQVYGTCHNNYHDTYNYHAIQLGEIFTKKKKKAKENQKKKKKKKRSKNIQNVPYWFKMPLLSSRLFPTPLNSTLQAFFREILSKVEHV